MSAPRASPRTLVISALVLAAVAAFAVFGLAGKGPPAGRAAPALPRERLAGGEVTLASLRGHPALVTFWASWCEPCAQEAPALERFSQGLHGQRRARGRELERHLAVGGALVHKALPMDLPQPARPRRDRRTRLRRHGTADDVRHRRLREAASDSARSADPADAPAGAGGGARVRSRATPALCAMLAALCCGSWGCGSAIAAPHRIPEFPVSRGVIAAAHYSRARGREGVRRDRQQGQTGGRRRPHALSLGERREVDAARRLPARRSPTSTAA